MKKHFKTLIFLFLAALPVTGYFYFEKSGNPVAPLVFEVGDVVDSLNGVKVFYNGNVGNVNGRNLTEDGYNLGLKYQCVEFVKRYYYEHYNHKMPDTWGHAKDFFEATVADDALNQRRGLLQFSNPSISRPQVGDLLVFDGTRFNPYGHVAIVSGVFDTEIEFIQQNPGPMGKSREKLSLNKLDGKWKLGGNHTLGWLRMR